MLGIVMESALIMKEKRKTGLGAVQVPNIFPGKIISESLLGLLF